MVWSDPPAAASAAKGSRLDPRAGYYTVPSHAIPDGGGNCFVQDLTVGRVGHGRIVFPGATDVAGLRFDETVFIGRKQVEVYPEGAAKPHPDRQVLNKRAVVSLEKVWPGDQLRDACDEWGARFVDWSPESGLFVFEVDHFSKYGLDDSDEDEKPGDVKKLKTLQLRAPPPPALLPPFLQKNPPGTETTTAAQVHSEDRPNATAGDDNDEDDGAASPPARLEAGDGGDANKVQLMKASLFDDEEMPQAASAASPRPVILQARPTILERRRDTLIEDIAHSILTGGAGKGLGGSFSASSEPSLTSEFIRTRFTNQSSAGGAQGHRQQESRQTKKPLTRYTLHAGYDKFVALPTSSGDVDKPKRVVPKYCNGRTVPMDRSRFADKLRYIADAGLTAGRSFRIGWASNGRFANPGNALGLISSSSSFADRHPVGRVCVESVNITSYGKALEEEQLRFIESWLEVSLENSAVEFDGAGHPRIEPNSGLESLQAHVEEATRHVAMQDTAEEKFGRALKEIKCIWDLCSALWGHLEDRREEADAGQDYGPDSHEVTMLRREAVSTWLEDIVDTSDRIEKNRSPVGETLALLSGNKLLEACDNAHESGDHYAALVMSSTGGCGQGSANGQLILQQMERWQEMHADSFVGQERLRLYALMAGVSVWSGSDPATTDVNVCQGLDWKRAFAAHLWYLTSPVSSIGDAFAAYEQAFQGDEAYAVAPEPEYRQHHGDDFHAEKSRDIKYHLLKLYSDRSHSMESILTPTTYTPDHLDHQVSWLLGQVLQSLGYNHMSVDKQDELHLNFASQLESFGLWHWSVYVLLHIGGSAEHRKSKILDVLGRHVRLADDDASERENFLQSHLRVPVSWIAEAKATKAASQQNWKDQAWYLIKAEQWSHAHDVVVKKIAPDAIVNDDYEFLYALLTELAAAAVSNGIIKWDIAGEVFFDFISVDMEVKKLLLERREDEGAAVGSLERLKPKVTSLCSRVSSLEVSTAKERLCQSEIAKRVAHLMRAVLSLEPGSSEAASRMLAQHLSQLPLPEDYALQELRTLARSYMMEIIEQ